ncbi:MAG: hypothetical protein ACTHKF_07285 [Candidatus Nitrosocosmicus sp.]
MKKIFFIDFDTVFSSLIKNKILNYDLDLFSDIELILPNSINIGSIFVKAINSVTEDSLLILDSLNGLIDSLNILNLSEIKNNKKNLKANNKYTRYRYASYQSFNILFFLLKKIENTKIPLIVTKYQSIEKSKKIISDLLNSNDFETNHFIRISDLVLFLEYIEKDFKTGFTILKNSGYSITSTVLREETTCSTFLSSSTKILRKRKDYFIPYSKWHYFNFIDI